MIKFAPYIIMATLVAMLIGLVVIERRKAGSALDELATVRTQNEGLLQIVTTQGQTIATLTNQRLIDETFTAQFASTLAAIQQDTARASTALTELRDTNPDVKTFLDTPIPDSVKRLYGKPQASPASPANR